MSITMEAIFGVEAREEAYSGVQALKLLPPHDYCQRLKPQPRPGNTFPPPRQETRNKKPSNQHKPREAT
ncbi:hypothetical protein FHS82_002581 [Pseudochelatococcus lubricantis]|uniref:Uncharacterized protein n=1 Tax=Pseudochelatococcus lubricantis TaxID=1538102 RepID=A0ABX0V0Q8_9HYPH|nr:hypothetical protein [Pseudochelatococcus lubricantis]NIJ58733.1 hypothetical protein [Pseudochelatococcus lubricantis]